MRNEKVEEEIVQGEKRIARLFILQSLFCYDVLFVTVFAWTTLSLLHIFCTNSVMQLSLYLVYRLFGLARVEMLIDLLILTLPIFLTNEDGRPIAGSIDSTTLT